MENRIGIRRFAGIRNGIYFEDDKVISRKESQTLNEWMDEIYKSSSIAYPKFHKMDRLSKLGFITAEVLLKGTDLHSKFGEDKIGIVLSNKSSSLDTDLSYYKLLERGIASPSVFVYTLPNILIGELCIRHKIKGESVFFVSDKYDVKQQTDYIRLMFDSGIVDACIGGWVELLNDSYESFLYLVTKEDIEGKTSFSETTVLNTYNKII